MEHNLVGRIWNLCTHVHVQIHIRCTKLFMLDLLDGGSMWQGHTYQHIMHVYPLMIKNIMFSIISFWQRLARHFKRVKVSIM